MKKIFLFSFIVAIIFSCKDKDPTLGVIYVIDTAGNPQSSTEIHLYNKNRPGTIYDEWVIADANGKYEREFKNEAIINLEARKVNTHNFIYIHPITGDTTSHTVTDSLYGAGVLRLEPHETVSVNVVIRIVRSDTVPPLP